MAKKIYCIITNKRSIFKKDFSFYFEKTIVEKIKQGFNLFLFLKSSYYCDIIEWVLDELMQKYKTFDVMYLLINACIIKRTGKICENKFSYFSQKINKIPFEREYFNKQKQNAYRYMIDISDLIVCNLVKCDELTKYAKNNQKEIEFIQE